jgi:hypothetical protein
MRRTRYAVSLLLSSLFLAGSVHAQTTTPPKTYQVPLAWTWTQGSGPAASGFILERRTPGGSWAEVQRTTADKRVITDTAEAGTYEYRIIVYNAMDKSAPRVVS